VTKVSQTKEILYLLNRINWSEQGHTRGSIISGLSTNYKI